MKISTFQTLVVSALLFVFGLSIPTVSLVAVVIAATWLIRPATRPGRAPMIDFALLAAFVVTYSAALVSFGFSPAYDAVRNGALVLLCFGIGVAVGRRQAVHQPPRAILLSLLAGFLVYALLSFKHWSLLLHGLPVGMVLREPWTGGDVGWTTVSFFSGGAACLLPWAIIPHNGGGRFARLTAIALSVVGLMITIVLQRRTPILAVVIAWLWTVFVLRRTQQGSGWDKAVRSGIVLVMFMAIGLLTSDIGVNQGLAQRFRIEGLDSGGRYFAWGAAIRGLLTHPFGGRATDIGGLSYVHSLWLDVAYTAGFIPLTALLLFSIRQLLHIRKLGKSLLRSDFVFVGVIGWSFALSFLVAPVLEASPTFFGAACVFAGVLSRLRAGHSLPVTRASYDPAILEPATARAQ